jgi:hypothetical protein
MIEYTVKVYSDCTEWRLNGKLHRTDGPAIERANGDRLWYLNGKLHRTDGPAIEHADDYREWYLNGKLHRTDGPALEWANANPILALAEVGVEIDTDLFKIGNGIDPWNVRVKMRGHTSMITLTLTGGRGFTPWTAI